MYMYIQHAHYHLPPSFSLHFLLLTTCSDTAIVHKRLFPFPHSALHHITQQEVELDIWHGLQLGFRESDVDVLQCVRVTLNVLQLNCV